MADLTAGGVPVYRDSAGVLREVPPSASASGSASAAVQDLDTNGNPVPTYKAHTYTYDDSGNLSTDTVTDGVNTWVRSYGPYTPTGPATDSGWVKQ